MAVKNRLLTLSCFLAVVLAAFAAVIFNTIFSERHFFPLRQPLKGMRVYLASNKANSSNVAFYEPSQELAHLTFDCVEPISSQVWKGHIDATVELIDGTSIDLWLSYYGNFFRTTADGKTYRILGDSQNAYAKLLEEAVERRVENAKPK